MERWNVMINETEIVTEDFVDEQRRLTDLNPDGQDKKLPLGAD